MPKAACFYFPRPPPWSSPHFFVSKDIRKTRHNIFLQTERYKRRIRLCFQKRRDNKRQVRNVFIIIAI